MSFTAPFALFSTTGGGNPAAIVFLPPSKHRKSTETLQEIATSLHQPITVFLSHSDSAFDNGAPKFDVRCFTSTTEMPINGHGLVAAAAALFAPSPSSHKPDSFDLPADTTTIRFCSSANMTLAARRHTLPNFYELELPASLTTPIPLDSDEGKILSRIIVRALGRSHDDEDMIVYIGKGEQGYENYLMVELDQKLDLSACEVDTDIMVSSYYVCCAPVFDSDTLARRRRGRIRSTCFPLKDDADMTTISNSNQGCSRR